MPVWLGPLIGVPLAAVSILLAAVLALGALQHSLSNVATARLRAKREAADRAGRAPGPRTRK